MTSVAFSPDGKTLASGSDDNDIILWDVARRQPLGEPLKGHQRDVTSVAFSPDGQTLASGSQDKTVRLWDIRLLGLLRRDRGPSLLLAAMAQAAGFLWQLDIDRLQVKNRPRTPTLLPHHGQYFVYDPRFRPLLDPPRPSESKFDQVWRWAEQQAARESSQ